MEILQCVLLSYVYTSLMEHDSVVVMVAHNLTRINACLLIYFVYLAFLTLVFLATKPLANIYG